MAISIQEGSFLVGVLRVRAHYLVFILGPLIFGNSLMGIVLKLL